jgi:acyl dehydratase
VAAVVAADADFRRRLAALVGRTRAEPQVGPDPVDRTLIRHWAEVLDDRNPIYVDDDVARATGRPGIVAPATMLQAWTMPGYRKTVEGTRYDPLWNELVTLLHDAGHIGRVATDCQQEYVRELVPGEWIRHTEVLESISDEKKTALGAGHFVTFIRTYTTDRGEHVGTELIRVYFYRPAAAPATERAAPAEPKPVAGGEELPPIEIPITATLIVAAAIATRDYEDIHHDHARATQGARDIYMNILATTGFVGRLVTDWAGPAARLKRVAIRLGVPNYPGDTMIMTGNVTARDGAVAEIAVRGRNGLGDHVTGAVTVEFPPA